MLPVTCVLRWSSLVATSADDSAFQAIILYSCLKSSVCVAVAPPPPQSLQLCGDPEKPISAANDSPERLLNDSTLSVPCYPLYNGGNRRPLRDLSLACCLLERSSAQFSAANDPPDRLLNATTSSPRAPSASSFTAQSLRLTVEDCAFAAAASLPKKCRHFSGAPSVRFPRYN